MSPAQSRKQQKFMFAHFGEDWVREHHFDKLKRKPQKQKVKPRNKKRGR
jgi:hypothetical protein